MGCTQCTHMIILLYNSSLYCESPLLIFIRYYWVTFISWNNTTGNIKHKWIYYWFCHQLSQGNDFDLYLLYYRDPQKLEASWKHDLKGLNTGPYMYGKEPLDTHGCIFFLLKGGWGLGNLEFWRFWPPALAPGTCYIFVMFMTHVNPIFYWP